MKTKLIYLFVFSILLIGLSQVATATVQPILQINQSNTFISQYSEMNFSVSEFSGQKSLNYLNLTIPAGYLFSIPNVSGSQVGTWNSTQPITVIDTSHLSVGSIGNISLSGNVMSLHLFAGDNPFAVNTNDSTIILQLYPFTWQNPSIQGIYFWNYSMDLAGDPQLYNAFTFTIIRDYTTNINNNFTSNNQYISCSANVTLNNNNSLGVAVNLSTLVNNTNINVQNISIQTYLNNSNYLNWSFILNTNDTVNVVTYAINNISQIVNFSMQFGNNNSIAIVNSFNGTNDLNASFILTNNNTVLINNYNNNTNFVDCSNNNTLAIVTTSNATALLNATFDLSNNNSIAVINLNNNTLISTIINNNSIVNLIGCGSNSSSAVVNNFNGSIVFNASFDLNNNNSLSNIISCNSNSSAYINAMFNNTNVYNASISFYSNLTNYFNASFALTNNNSINLMALWNNTNNNLFNVSFSFSNNNTWLLANINNNTYYNINNITINSNNSLECNPVLNGSSYDAPTYQYLMVNTTVNATCPASPPVTCTNTCPTAAATTSSSEPLNGYAIPAAIGSVGLLGLVGVVYAMNRIRKPELIKKPRGDEYGKPSNQPEKSPEIPRESEVGSQQPGPETDFI